MIWLKITAAALGAVLALVLAVADSVTAAVAAAVITGGFTVLNTVLNLLIHRQARRNHVETQSVRAETEMIRQSLTSPRRMIFDAEGNPIGTVLDLHATGGWDDWLGQQSGAQAQRRTGDAE